MKKMQNKTQTHSPKQRRDDESPRTARSSQLPRLLALSFMLCRCFLPMRTLCLSLLSLFLSLFLSVFSSSFAFFAPSSFFTFFRVSSLFPFLSLLIFTFPSFTPIPLEANISRAKITLVQGVPLISLDELSLFSSFTLFFRTCKRDISVMPIYRTL